MSEQPTTVDYVELLSAISQAENCAAYVNSGSGEITLANGHDSMFGDTLTGDSLIAVPTEADLGLGTTLVMRFAENNLPDDVAMIQGFFQRRNAYRMFYGLLENRGCGAAWTEFLEDAREHALREWCSQHQLALKV